MAGIVVWEGKSQINRDPIVLIATNNSDNVKTGDMIQTWILHRRVNPVEAVMSGKDKAICGSCPLRKKVCYVAVHQAPLQIWRLYKRKGYPKPKDPTNFMKEKALRIGSYGDGVAVPISIWRNLLKVSAGHTGYTHSWRTARFQKYRDFLMASCETEQDVQLANRMGWRTFRVKQREAAVLKREIVCPASPEGNHKSTCAKCLLCNGAASIDKRKPFSSKNIVINVHGLPFKEANFQKIQTGRVSLL